MRTLVCAVLVAVLAGAGVPTIAIATELGINDARFSDMGAVDGVGSYGASSPAVAYNSADDEYLLVWSGHDNTAPLVSGEGEIFGQRIDAATGAEIGSDFRLSQQGPDGDYRYDAADPALAYNSTDNEYLVVWRGTALQTAFGLKYDIYGQRVDAATGAEIGSDFRLSHTGPDEDIAYDSVNPAVAYNSTDNEYLVVWEGTHVSGLFGDSADEIFGQRIDAATGAEVGPDDFVLSDMGSNPGSYSYGGFNASVAYGSADNEYLVVWQGSDDTGDLVAYAYEVFGQRLDGTTGAEVGSNDFRISDMGADDRVSAYRALRPVVVYNGDDNEYLVVWSGSDDLGSMVGGEHEIFAQRIDAASGAEIGSNDFRLSDMGSDGDLNYDADYPAVVYNSAQSEYLVVWQGDDDSGKAGDNAFEIFAQRLDATTEAELGANDFRISDVGQRNQAKEFDAYSPAVAHAAPHLEYLAFWSGNDDQGATVETEIYGQRLGVACSPSPLACDTPAKIKLGFKNHDRDSKDQIKLDMKNGSLAERSAFGDPTSTDAYELCLYVDDALVAESGIPAGAGEWRESALAYKYKNKTGNAEGVNQLQLRAGRDGAPEPMRGKLKGRGVNLVMPALPLAEPFNFKIQIVSSVDDACWGGEFTEADAAINTVERLSLKKP